VNAFMAYFSVAPHTVQNGEEHLEHLGLDWPEEKLLRQIDWTQPSCAAIRWLWTCKSRSRELLVNKCRFQANAFVLRLPHSHRDLGCSNQDNCSECGWRCVAAANPQVFRASPTEAPKIGSLYVVCNAL
jgi:hypothetical protein